MEEAGLHGSAAPNKENKGASTCFKMVEDATTIMVFLLGEKVLATKGLFGVKSESTIAVD